jgi:2,3-diketo-5-methylthiopentyl-1-phosphate enolase
VLNYFSYPHDRPEHAEGDCFVATYLVYGTTCANVLDKAGAFAVGQSIGTWIEVPGVSAEMIERRQARVLALIPAGETGNEPVFLLRLAFPRENFGDSFTMLMTALAGNDVSTALRTRLVDLELSGPAAEAFPGPKKGIEDVRALAGVAGRPLVLNMIKPCAGFTPEEGAKLFFEAAAGGVDLIKDDELLGSPAYNSVAKRTILYLKAAAQAREISGRLATYLPNISGSPRLMRDNARAVVDAGGKACLVNFVFGGLDALAELADEFGDRLFIMVHYAGVGVMGWERGGIANSVFIGILPRLAGAHAVMTMLPNRADAAAMHDFYRTVQAQRLPMRSTRPVLTAVGGGITPVNQARVQEDLGPDLIIGIGGAIQGHPLGTTVGARTAMAAVEATARGIPLAEAAVGNEGLRIALKNWG